MSEEFTGRYEIDDGYAGGARRPQYFRIDADNLDDEMTDDDITALYHAQAIEAFHNNITCYAVDGNEFLAWAHEQIAARKQEEELDHDRN